MIVSAINPNFKTQNYSRIKNTPARISGNQKAKTDLNFTSYFSVFPDADYWASYYARNKHIIPASKKIGLNKYIGFDYLKKRVYNSVLIPLCKVMDGENAHASVPNGVNLFGPKGTGKTFFASQLGEHYVEKGGSFEELDLTGDVKLDNEYLNEKFKHATNDFYKSGRKKYTMFFIDEVEKKYDRANVAQQPVLDNLLELTHNCRDRGIIFVSTANYLNRVEPNLMRDGRTDLRLEVGYIKNFDLAAIVKHFIEKNNLPIEEFRFGRIIDPMIKSQIKYKPKDIENSLIRVSKDYVEYGGKIDANEMIKALVNKDFKLANQLEQYQFNKDQAAALQEICK